MRLKIGLMGPAISGELEKRTNLVQGLVNALQAHNAVLVTGECAGFPGAIAAAYRAVGGFTVGVAGALNRAGHIAESKGRPIFSDVTIYTGFGLKGRNVVNVRSSDVVLIAGGRIGTLNEFTIAFDEGKIIGVLEGTGGCADMVAGIIKDLGKQTGAQVFYHSDPQILIQQCYDAWQSSCAADA